ncbi:MAG: hypothetical protein WD042_09490 [Phycisphaeraceae bacterium]
MTILTKLCIALAFALAFASGCSKSPVPLPDAVAALEKQLLQRFGTTGESLSQVMVEMTKNGEFKELNEQYSDADLFKYAQDIAWTHPLRSWLCQMSCSDFRTNKEHLDLLMPRLPIMTTALDDLRVAIVAVLFDNDVGFTDRSVLLHTLGQAKDGDIMVFVYVMVSVTDAEQKEALSGEYGNGMLRVVTIETVLDDCKFDNVKRAEELRKYQEFLTQSDVGKRVLRFNELTLEGKGHEELVNGYNKWASERKSRFEAEWQRNIAATSTSSDSSP